MQPNTAFVVGVGMSRFEKPGRIPGWDYPQYGKIAVLQAFRDCGLDYSDAEQAYAGYCYGDSCQGQRVLYEVGMTGIPIVNVNNNCSTGSSALFLARNAILSGQADCVLVLGFEKMAPGSLGSHFPKQANPLGELQSHMEGLAGCDPKAPFACQFFANGAREHMELFGSTPEHFAKIAEKNHRHSALNPYSQFRDIYTLDQILASPTVFAPMTKLQCCPTSDGAAAVVLVSSRFIQRLEKADPVKASKLKSLAVEMAGQGLATDPPIALHGRSRRAIAGYDMSKLAASKCYAQVKAAYPLFDVKAHVGVAEVHDCFSANELLAYEATGLAEEGTAHKDLVDSKANTYGGRVVVNPSGGLISKGHPLGATGLAQCAELSWQLRGVAGERQVRDMRHTGAPPEFALQHNIGLGGAAVITVYTLGFPEDNVKNRRELAGQTAANNPDAGDIPKKVMDEWRAKNPSTPAQTKAKL